MKSFIYSILSFFFTLSLPLFMLMGFALVVVQFIGALIGNGELVLMAGKCEIYCIWMSVLAGFLGFAASYFAPPKPKKK